MKDLKILTEQEKKEVCYRNIKSLALYITEQLDNADDIKRAMFECSKVDGILTN